MIVSSFWVWYIIDICTLGIGWILVRHDHVTHPLNLNKLKGNGLDRSFMGNRTNPTRFDKHTKSNMVPTSVAKFLSMAYINGRRSLVFHWEVPGRWLQYSQLSNYSIALSSFVLVIYVYVLFCYSLGLKSVRISPKRRLVIK